MIRTKKGNFIMSEKIVLIDGHSILNRAFYGVPDLTNSEGMHTNAVYGFLSMLDGHERHRHRCRKFTYAH